MVDFQSRDTRRRGGGSEDETESERGDAAAEDADPEADAAETEPQAAPARTDEQSQADTEETAASETADESATEAVSAPADARRGDSEVETAETTVEGDDEPTDRERPAAGTATRSVDIALVAVGDAATPEDDPNTTTDRLTDSLTAAGHSVPVTRELAGGYDEVQSAVDGLVSRPDVDVVVTVGGTGVAQSEVVIEAVHPLFEKVLPGFGEVVRDLLFYQAGTSVVGVRTTAGVTGESPIFCLPGERTLAVRAVEEVVATEAPALVSELE